MAGVGARGATLAGIGAIALWSSLALLSRAAAAIPPLQVTAMSFSVSGGLGLAALAATGRLGALRQRPAAWAHGVGGLFGFHALFFTALALAPPASANLLNYSWPLLIVLLSAPLLGLRLTWRHAAGVALGAAGCALLLGNGASFAVGGAALAGYAAACASALIWALYSVLARRFSDVPTASVAGFCAATALLAWVAAAATVPLVAPDARALAAVLLLGAGPVGAAFFLWDMGMKRGDPRLLGTLAYATPVASTLALIAAGEAPFAWTTVAAALLVAAGGLVAARG